MVKEDYYRLKDIILGFRNEYEENEKKLDRLRKYVVLSDKKLKDIYFYLSKHQDMNSPELDCVFVKNRSKLGQLLVDYNKSRGYVFLRDTGSVWRNFNDEYKILGNFQTQIYSDRMFDMVVKEIMNSEFAKNVQSPYLEICDGKNRYSLAITPTGINFDIWNKDMGNLDSIVSYDSRTDGLTFIDYSKEDCLTSFSLGRTLTCDLLIHIPRDILSDYHRKIIDNSDDSNKAIMVDNIDNKVDKITHYSFDDDSYDRAVVLKKSKIKKS